MKLRRIAAVVVKETREIVRDPITVWVCLLLPLVMLFLFGYAINLDVENVAMGVLDHDQSPASRALTDRFVENDYFRLTRSFESDADVEAALQRGDVKLALIIPPDFQRRLSRGELTLVQVLVDGTYSSAALIITNYARAITSARWEAAPGAVRLEMRVWYNAPLRSANYIVPGLYGVILMAFTPLLTTLAIVREKESGSIQQIFASPLTSSEFVLGKLVPYGLIAFFQILLVIATGFFWFAVPFAGNLGFLLATALIYVFCTVGIGLLISTVFRTQLSAMLAALIVTLMPSFLFSGVLFPVFTMPYVLQLYAQIFPTRYFVELSRGVALKGTGVPELWLNVLLLFGYTSIVFVLAAWRLRKKVA